MPPSRAPTWSNHFSGSVWRRRRSRSAAPSRSGPGETTSVSQSCLPQPVSRVATTGRRPVDLVVRATHGRRSGVRDRLTTAAAGARRRRRRPPRRRPRPRWAGGTGSAWWKGLGWWNGFGSMDRSSTMWSRPTRLIASMPYFARAFWSSTQPSGAMVAFSSATVRSRRTTPGTGSRASVRPRACSWSSVCTVASQPSDVGDLLQALDHLGRVGRHGDDEPRSDVHRAARAHAR